MIHEAASASSEIAPRTAAAICWSEADWARIGEEFEAAETRNVTSRDGFVEMPSSVANLSPETYHRLDQIVYDDVRYESSTAAIPVGALVHEAIHVGGIRDEAIADCYAMQLVALAASTMGASEAYGSLLADIYLERNLWFTPGTEYDSDECRGGGALDLGFSIIWQ